MRTSRVKRRQATNTLTEIRARKEQIETAAAINAGALIPVDRSKIVSRSAIPQIPDFYRDIWFTCKDCGERELWTAKQQKRWHEEQAGEIEAVAIRCRACRRKERKRREEARKIHLEGIARKRAQQRRASSD
jgi:hypothetical protein